MKAQIPTLKRKLIFILVAAAGLILVAHELELHLIEIERWVLNLGLWAPLGFIFLFVFLTPLLISVDALCFAAGLLFPLVAGECYMILATYLAAAFIFLLARYFFKEQVESFIAQRKKFSNFNGVLKRHAFKLMFLLRLTPLPFAVLSYAFAVAPVRFWHYLGATSGIFIYNGTLVYLGYTAKHIAGLISGSGTQAAVPHSLLIAGLLVTMAVLFYVSRLAGRTLSELGAEE